jgi:cellobiose-specific phosphotransferase system component IIB
MSDRFGADGRKKIITKLSKGKIPIEIINRRKYGFVDAMRIKEDNLEAR